KKLRAATSEQLKRRANAALEIFAAHGTTTIEAKSGYGLDVASELKILSLHKELGAAQPIEIVSPFLGAHVVRLEFRAQAEGPGGEMNRGGRDCGPGGRLHTRNEPDCKDAGGPVAGLRAITHDPRRGDRGGHCQRRLLSWPAQTNRFHRGWQTSGFGCVRSGR